MIAPLARLKTRLARIKGEQGSTDPILALAVVALTLVLLVGGSFAVAGIITNGHNLNAKSDLDRVSVAETANYAQNDAYLAYTKNGTAAETALEKSGVGFSPTDDGNLAVVVSGNGWAAISKSGASGGNTYYVKTSEGNQIADSNGATLTGPNATKVNAGLSSLGITVAQLKSALK